MWSSYEGRPRIRINTHWDWKNNELGTYPKFRISFSVDYTFVFITHCFLWLKALESGTIQALFIIIFRPPVNLYPSRLKLLAGGKNARPAALTLRVCLQTVSCSRSLEQFCADPSSPHHLFSHNMGSLSTILDDLATFHSFNMCILSQGCCTFPFLRISFRHSQKRSWIATSCTFRWF